MLVSTLQTLRIWEVLRLRIPESFPSEANGCEAAITVERLIHQEVLPTGSAFEIKAGIALREVAQRVLWSRFAPVLSGVGRRAGVPPRFALEMHFSVR